MTELIGILLVVQGVGGLLHEIVGVGSPSWFVSLQVVPPGLHALASVIMLTAGIGVLFGSQARRTRRDRSK